MMVHKCLLIYFLKKTRIKGKLVVIEVFYFYFFLIKIFIYTHNSKF